MSTCLSCCTRSGVHMRAGRVRLTGLSGTGRRQVGYGQVVGADHHGILAHVDARLNEHDVVGDDVEAVRLEGAREEVHLDTTDHVLQGDRRPRLPFLLTRRVTEEMMPPIVICAPSEMLPSSSEVMVVSVCWAMACSTPASGCPET